MRAYVFQAALCLCLALGGMAASAGPAGDLIRQMSDEAIAALSDGGQPLVQREKRLQGLLDTHFDLERIARFAVGRYWRAATPEQQSDYIKAFSDYIMARYARRIGGYSGETLELVSERPTETGDVLVETRILRPAGPPIAAEWRVRTDGGRPLIIDIVIEGMSMALAKRAAFAALIRQNGIDGLILVLQADTGRKGARP